MAKTSSICSNQRETFGTRTFNKIQGYSIDAINSLYTYCSELLLALRMRFLFSVQEFNCFTYLSAVFLHESKGGIFWSF
jgi:hypothetical protein